MIRPDIDIDVKPPFKPESIFPNVVPASIVSNDKLKRHPVGCYFQNIPKYKDLSAIPYKEAENCGFIKVDFLHLNILSNFKNKDEIRDILEREPNWSLLQKKEIVSQLFQLHDHFDILEEIQPKDIQSLADCIAIIRPTKIKLLNKYLKDPVKTRIALYKKEHQSDYRKSHAIAYAHVIVLQMCILDNGFFYD